MSAESKLNKWSNGELLAVMLAVQNDKGYSANHGVTCPVCKTDSLQYEEASPLDMEAYCSKCHAGLRQGKGISRPPS